jgi:Mg-chelatase subunit ChlD
LANRFARRPGARAPATPPPASALSDTNAYPQSLLGGDRNIGAGGTPAVASGATDYGFGNAVPVETNGLSPQATNQEEYKLNAVGYINAELLPGYNVVTVPLSNLENTITSSVQEGSQGQQQPPQQGANEFQWNLGTTVMKNGAIGLQGGTAPSYQGPSATANPSGLFPGGVSPSTTTPVPFTPEPGVVAASAADASLTLGLRRRPGNGQVGASNFTVDKDTGQVFIIADDATTSSASQVVSNQAVHNSNNPFITRYAYEVTPRERDKLSGVKQGEWQLHIEEADQNKNLETGLTGKAGERAQEAEQLVRSRQDNLGVKDDSFSFANNTATNVTSFSLLEDQQKIAGDTKESGKAALAPQALAPPANTNEPANISYNFSGVPVEQVLDTYGKLVGRTLLKSTTGPADVPKDATITLKTEKPLTRSEAIESLETILGRNGVTVVNIGDKAAKVVIDTMAGKEGGSIKPVAPPLTPQPEVLTSANIFSTFSLNVSDAAFKLAQAGLQNGVMPDPASIRSEEFINAFDYRDPEPAPGAPLGFAWERAAYPFAHNRDLLRFSVKTAAQGRQPGRPLNLVLLLDKSGSMERADRVEIIHQALRVLASQLNAQDTLSVVVFARTARLWVDGAPGSQAGEVANRLDSVTPEGGTNLEEAMRLAYQTALRHYNAGGENRVVLMTDGAANLGNVEPESLKQNVEANRKQGIALDCFGIGWDGYNDNLMETLSRTGHGRYGFINTPEEAATEFAGQLAGALRVAASDVKVQVEFNPNRVASWRQIGYAKHQLTKEQFRDNTVAAAQIGAAESGNALYTVEVNPLGDGPLCTVRARFHAPGSTDVQEHAWDVPYTGTATPLDTASPAMRLAATSSAFSEWLAGSPYAVEVTPDQLLAYLRGVPEIYGADARPKNLEWMIRQAKSISGK